MNNKALNKRSEWVSQQGFLGLSGNREVEDAGGRKAVQAHFQRGRLNLRSETEICDGSWAGFAPYGVHMHVVCGEDREE